MIAVGEHGRRPRRNGHVIGLGLAWVLLGTSCTLRGDDTRGPEIMSCDSHDDPRAYGCSEVGWALDGNATWDEDAVRDYCACVDRPDTCIPAVFARSACPPGAVSRCLFGTPTQAAYQYPEPGVDYTDPGIRGGLRQTCDAVGGQAEFL